MRRILEKKFVDSPVLFLVLDEVGFFLSCKNQNSEVVGFLELVHFRLVQTFISALVEY